MNNTMNGMVLESFAAGYLDGLKRSLAELQLPSVSAFTRTIFEARQRGSRIFFIGNGGSATTASHFANDIAIGSRSWITPFRAVSLADNTAVITSLANDYGYDSIFVKQLKAQMVSGDVVVAISASGNSPNVLRAVEYANVNGGITVALTGFDGGQLLKIAKLSVHVPTAKGNYGHTEDVHMIIDHLVAAYILKVCEAETDGNARGGSK